VNGELELQARKKILGGQTVVIAGRTLLVKLGAATAVKTKVAPKPAAKTASKPSAPASVKGAHHSGAAGTARVSTEKPKGFAKPPGGARPAKRAQPAYRERDTDGNEDGPVKEKPNASAAVQRTFFYTELLKAQQSKRKKR